MKSIIFTVLITLLYTKVFAVPNMSDYVEGETFDGIVTGIYKANGNMKYTCIDGAKVAVGYEKSSNTMVIFGRTSAEFFCKLIDNKGKVDIAETFMTDPLEGCVLTFEFEFDETNRNIRTFCEVCDLMSQTPTFLIYTITMDPSFSYEAS